MHKRYSGFFISLAVILLSIAAIDILIGALADYGMSRLPGNDDTLSKEEYRLYRLTSDIVILGSSRAKDAYDDTMLRDSISRFTGRNHSVFNAGVIGKFVDNNCCVAETIMDRYSPELIIFDMRAWELGGGKSESDMESVAFAYKSNRFIKQSTDALGWKERIKMTSNMFRYNRKLPELAAALLNGSMIASGYQPRYGNMRNPPTERIPKEKDIDNYSLMNFKRMLQTAADKRIPVIVVTSPRFLPGDSNSSLADICAGYNVPYIDLYDTDLFNAHPEYFDDYNHLNNDGAQVFTRIFFNAIKPYLEPFLLTDRPHDTDSGIGIVTE